MLFSEIRFFIFFAVVLYFYWSLKNNRNRKVWLLVCSYFFYGSWDWRFLSLIIISTLVNYKIGRDITRYDDHKKQKQILLLGICFNLGILGFFKYFNFFTESTVSFAQILGISLNYNTLQILLPLGISFYTFESISYIVDVFSKKLTASGKLLNFALFIAFFPKLIAGPIIRPHDFLPQLTQQRSFVNVDVRGYLILFLTGFFKKACLSDNLSPFVDAYFKTPSAYSVWSAWVAVLFYAVQIYCDFSGYSDMAIASAGLLGYKLPENFNAPYFSSNITEFWRRWHISLSTWLKDYLYIPLGGSRGSKLFIYRNLMLTMVLGGLWHGASWNFIIWGFMHGLALILQKELVEFSKFSSLLTAISKFIGTLLTFYWVCIAWIFFRAMNFTTAFEAVKAFVFFQSSGINELQIPGITLFAMLAVLHWIAYKKIWGQWGRSLPTPIFAAAFGVLVAFAIALPPLTSQPFIYFQF